MAKQKSISDLVMELQEQNEALKRLEKLAERYVKEEFGYSVKELHNLIRKQELFERKMQERESGRQGKQS